MQRRVRWGLVKHVHDQLDFIADLTAGIQHEHSLVHDEFLNASLLFSIDEVLVVSKSVNTVCVVCVCLCTWYILCTFSCKFIERRYLLNIFEHEPCKRHEWISKLTTTRTPWHHQEWPTLAWLESPKPWRKH